MSTAVQSVTLAAARKAARIPQKRLGELLGVAQNTVSGWELGRSEIPADRLSALTRRLGLPPGSIAARQPLAPHDSSRSDAVRCGTYSGAIGHVRRGETACEPCKQARRDYATSRRVLHPRPAAECGTNRGYHAHRYRGQDACTACRAAHARYASEWRRSA